MGNQDLVGVKEVAQVFGVSTRRVEQLVQEGILTPAQQRPRKFDLMQTCKDYISFLSDKANGRDKKEKDSSLETQKLEAETRAKTAKAKMIELDLEELEGRMHRAEDVEAIMTDHVMMFRSMLLSMPGKLAVDLVKENTAAGASERIKREVFHIMKFLADYEYNPEDYKKRMRDRRGWSDKNEETERE